jgi:hypothetical protein
MIKRKFSKMNEWLISDKRKNLATILFFISAGFGILSMFGIKILLIQNILLYAGWYVLFVRLKKLVK